MKLKNVIISCEQAIDIAKSIYAFEFIDPTNGNSYKQILLLSEEQNRLAELFEF